MVTIQQAEQKAIELAGIKPEEIFKPQGQVKFYIQEQPIFYDTKCLWWAWNKNKLKWEITDEVDILNHIEKITGEDIITPKNRTLILNSLKQECRKTIPKDMKQTWVQFKNKIYDIETNEVFNVIPDYFIANPIDIEIGTVEDTPIIDSLFSSWVGEEHKIELYELLAFCLVPSYFIDRLFCLIGSGANGKSSLLNLLVRFISIENITTTSLYLLLNNNFEGSKLLKKLVCLMGETNFNLLTNTDMLKKLTGRDLVRCEFKGKNCFDFKSYAKLIMATNSLPPTADKTDGFYRRWKIINFPNKFKEEKDILSAIPEIEYNNLALKCLNIAKKLWVERKFTKDGSFEERRRIYEEHSNPIHYFIQENYEKNVDSEVLFSDFKEEFEDYLINRGFRTLSAKGIVSQLKNEGFVSKLATIKGVNAQWILGLKIKENTKIKDNNEINDVSIHLSHRNQVEQSLIPLTSLISEGNSIENLQKNLQKGLEDIKVIPKQEDLTNKKEKVVTKKDEQTRIS